MIMVRIANADFEELNSFVKLTSCWKFSQSSKLFRPFFKHPLSCIRSTTILSISFQEFMVVLVIIIQISHILVEYPLLLCPVILYLNSFCYRFVDVFLLIVMFLLACGWQITHQFLTVGILLSFTFTYRKRKSNLDRVYLRD